MSDTASGSRKTRGARACVACRKGKNRCVVPDGTDGPCERCVSHGLACVYEPRSAKGDRGGGGGHAHDEDRMDRLEDTVHQLTSAVSQLVQAQYQNAGPSLHTMPPHSQQQGYPYWAGPPLPPIHAQFQQQPHPASMHAAMSPPATRDTGTAYSNERHAPTTHSVTGKRRRSDTFPELPGYKAPPHPLLRYGIAETSNAPSSDEEDVMMASTQLTAPFEALAEAAAAASMASNNGSSSGNTPQGPPQQLHPQQTAAARKRKKARVAPPPNAFPSVVQKGLVKEDVAKRIFVFYIENMHRAFPILDPVFDTWESLHERSPWSINAILSVAGQRMPDPDSDIVKATEYATEEAHGIARSSLFGPTVRKEGAQAMTIIAAWQQNGYLPAGHALRMTHDLGLHRALGKLAEARESKNGSPEDERELLASARVYVSAYWLDNVLSSGAGRPSAGDPIHFVASQIQHLLDHSTSIKSDYVLAANIELLRLRHELEASVHEASEPRLVSSKARAAGDQLKGWWRVWDDKLSAYYDSQSFERKMLLCSLYAAEMALISTALRFQSLSGREALSEDVKDLVMAARQSAASYIDIMLDSHALKSTLRFCLHPSYANSAYSGLLLIKFAKLWPIQDDLQGVVSRCNRLQHLLAGVPGASHFAFTIRIALERFARHFNLPFTPFPAALPSHKVAQTSNGTLASMSPYAASLSATQAALLPSYSAGGTSENGTNRLQSHHVDLPGLSSSTSAASSSVSSSTATIAATAPSGETTDSSPLDVNSLFSNNDWTTGHGQGYPEWLKPDTSADKQDWAFADVLQTGLDGLFLPTWTLQLDGNQEWWAAQ